MTQKIIVMLLFCFLGEAIYAQTFDTMVKVELQNKALIRFIEEFVNAQGDEQGVCKLHIFQDRDDQSIYEISFASWWYPYEDDVASLTYTEVAGRIVLLYTGMESLLPSKDRYRKQTVLIKDQLDKFFSREDVPPTGTWPTASIVICGEDSIIYQAAHGLVLPDEYSCILEEPAERDEE